MNQEELQALIATGEGQLLDSLRSLIDAGFVEMIIPDKPQSSKQKYRLTEEGRQFVKKI